MKQYYQNKVKLLATNPIRDEEAIHSSDAFLVLPDAHQFAPMGTNFCSGNCFSVKTK